MPPAKRQPNLLFAAARYLLGDPPDITSLRTLAGERPDVLAGLMMERLTQTNLRPGGIALLERIPVIFDDLPCHRVTIVPHLKERIPLFNPPQRALKGLRVGAIQTQQRGRNL